MPCKNGKEEGSKTEKKSELLTVANSVARGTSSLTKKEMDAFYYVMAFGRVAHRVNVADDAEILVVSIPMETYVRALSQDGKVQVKKSELVRNLKAIIDDQETITYKDAEGGINISRCFYKIRIKKDEIHVLIDADVAKVFWGLTKNFTETAIDVLIGMRSRFSVALYLNIKSRLGADKRPGEFSISTSNLKTFFGLSKQDYVRKDGTFNRSIFERKTIGLAVKEINKVGDVAISYRKDRQLFPDANGINKWRITGYVISYKAVGEPKAVLEKPMGQIVADHQAALSGPTGVKPTPEDIRKEFLGDDSGDADAGSYDNPEYFDK